MKEMKNWKIKKSKNREEKKELNEMKLKGWAGNTITCRLNGFAKSLHNAVSHFFLFHFSLFKWILCNTTLSSIYPYQQLKCSVDGYIVKYAMYRGKQFLT